MPKLREGQLTKQQGWSGATAPHHLQAAFQHEPVILSNAYQKVIDASYHNNFMSMVRNLAPIEYIERDAPFEYHLMGAEDNRCSLLGAFADRGMSQPLTPSMGAVAQTVEAGQDFYMLFNRKIFFFSSVIAGYSPDEFQFLIRDDGSNTTNGWLFKVSLLDEAGYNCPVSEFEKGINFSIIGGATAKLGTTKGQGITFQTPYKMQQYTSDMRMEHQIHGAMLNHKVSSPLWTYFEDGKGGKVPYWIDHEMAKLLREFEKRRFMNFWYARSTMSPDGTSVAKGESDQILQRGNGVRNQIMPSNQYRVNTVTFKMLEDLATDTLYRRGQFEGGEIVIGTGIWGLRDLDAMLRKELSENSFGWLGDTTGRAFKWSENNINVSFGNFVGYATVGNMRFKFMHLPFYDDKDRNSNRPHPRGGYEESHRLTMMNFGSKDNPTIKRIRVKDSEPSYAIINGIRAPWFAATDGRATGINAKYASQFKLAASSFDGCEVHIRDTEGAVILDPTKCVEIIPNIKRK